MKNEFNMLNYYPQFNGICTIDKCTMDQWITLVISLQAENSIRLKTTKPALKLQKTKPKTEAKQQQQHEIKTKKSAQNWSFCSKIEDR